MKKFTSKNIFEKFILVIVCVILLNFCISPVAQATGTDDSGGTSFGGKMMAIMRDFTTAIADVAASVVQLGMTGEWSYAVAERGTGEPDTSAPKGDYWVKQSEFSYPILQISPEVIFANKVQLLDANFISSQTTDSSKYLIEAKNTAPISTLRKIVASWYVTLRTIAVVGLLSVLIYIGIRIIISSTAQDKAKYKQRLVDWVIAFCLLFFMHYIMAAVVTVVEKVNAMLSDDVLNGISLNPDYGNVTYVTNNIIETDDGTISGGVEDVQIREEELDTAAIEYVISLGGGKTPTEISEWRYIYGVAGEVKYKCTITFEDTFCEMHKVVTLIGGGQGSTMRKINYAYEYADEDGKTYLLDGHPIDIEDIKQWIKDKNQEEIDTSSTTSKIEGLKKDGEGRYFIDGDKVLYFTNYARMYLNVKDKDAYLPMSTAYLIIYIALVTFTVVFTIRYIKRVIYIAFLTLMAPMVALTYPIDKIKDRKSASMGYVV